MSLNLQTANPFWTPANLTRGMAAWFDCADPRYVVESGGAVSQITDKSGKGMHLTQEEGMCKPIYNGRQINSLPSVEFDTTAKLMQGATASDWSFLHGPDGNAMFVLNYIDDFPEGGPFSYIGTYSGAAGFQHGAMKSGGNDSHYYSYFANDTLVIEGSSPPNGTPFGQTQLLSWEHGAARTNDLGGYINGEEVNNVNYMYTPVGGFPNSSPFNYCSGGMITSILGEMIFLDYLPTVAERQSIEGYMMWKWGAQSLIFAGHPAETEPQK